MPEQAPNPVPSESAADPSPAQETPVIDIHTPQASIHGWRDFLLHLTVITIGLLIALSLEATVEWMHHRHIVSEARADIRQEMKDNHQMAQKDMQYIQEDIDRMKRNINTIRRLRADPKNFHGEIQFTMTWSSFNDSAWRSSRDMGALSYMGYPEVQKYADLYGQQDFVKQEAINVFTKQALSATPLYMEKDVSSMTQPAIQELLHDSAATLIGLTTLEQTLQGLDQQYADALSKH